MKNYLLQKIGGYLIREEKSNEQLPAFVLGGGPYDRTREAARLYQKGKVYPLICTGITQNNDYTVLGEEYPEWKITRAGLLNQGVPKSAIQVMHSACSTAEEVRDIYAYCQKNNWPSAAIVTHKFHSRRVWQQIQKWKYPGSPKLYLYGAASSQYNEVYWWQHTVGFFTVQNEYIKLLVYKLRKIFR